MILRTSVKQIVQSVTSELVKPYEHWWLALLIVSFWALAFVWGFDQGKEFVQLK